jgi:YggT family protein
MIYLYYAIRLYEMVLIVRIFLSWIQHDENHPVIRWIYRLTDPILEPARRMIPVSAGGFDFSPIAVFIVIDIIKRVLFRTSFF